MRSLGGLSLGLARWAGCWGAGGEGGGGLSQECESWAGGTGGLGGWGKGLGLEAWEVESVSWWFIDGSTDGLGASPAPLHLVHPYAVGVRKLAC